MMQDEKQDSSVKASILAVNNCVYQLQPDLSIAVSRTMCKQYAMAQQHAPRDTIVFNLNTGSAYVDFKDSYLELTIVNKSTGGTDRHASWGSNGCSAANIINRLTISSRSGQVLERIDRANQLSAIRVMYEKNAIYAQYGIGSAAGITNPFATSAAAADDLDWDDGVGSRVRVVIQLGMISPFFDTCNQLLPCQLSSGMKIELLLESADVAMVMKSAAATPSYLVSSCSLNLQSYLLSDVVMRTLSEMSSSSGLELVHETVYSAIGQRTSTVLNTEFSKAASRVLKAVYHERPTASPDSTVSKFAAVPWSDATASLYCCLEQQWRLGSQYFPNTSIRGDVCRESAPEIYAAALQAFGAFTPDNPVVFVSEKQFMNGGCVFAQSFERSSVLQLAGQPTSNSRVINFSAKFADAGTNRESSVYVFYTQLVRVFASNCVIEQ